MVRVARRWCPPPAGPPSVSRGPLRALPRARAAERARRTRGCTATARKTERPRALLRAASNSPAAHALPPLLPSTKDGLPHRPCSLPHTRVGRAVHSLRPAAPWPATPGGRESETRAFVKRAFPLCVLLSRDACAGLHTPVCFDDGGKGACCGTCLLRVARMRAKHGDDARWHHVCWVD